MRSLAEALLAALALTFAAQVLLVAARVPSEALAISRDEAPAALAGAQDEGDEAEDPLRAELLVYLHEDLQRLQAGSAPDLAASPAAGGSETDSSPAQTPRTGKPGEARPDAGSSSALPSAGRKGLLQVSAEEYRSWLALLPAELGSWRDAGPLRRFLRTLAAFALAVAVWLGASMAALASVRTSWRAEHTAVFGALLLASCLPVFSLSAFGYGSLLLAGAGAGVLGGLLIDGFLGVRALLLPMPGHVLAASGHGCRWMGAGGLSGMGSAWQRWTASLDYQLLRPQLPALLFLLRSRLPLLLGGVVVAELALDVQGLGRTFNHFDQPASQGAFLSGVLLCFCLIRLFSAVVRRLEVRFDPLLAHRPTSSRFRPEPLEHEPGFSLLRRHERLPAVLLALGALGVLAGYGWLAGLALAAVAGAPLRKWLLGLRSTGRLGLVLCAPVLLLPLVPPAWLERAPVVAELAGSGRRALAAVLVVLLALRPVLRAQLRGGASRRLADGFVHGLEALPQVLTAVLLLRLGFLGLDRLYLSSPLAQQALAGALYGLFGVAFLVRALVEPLGSMRQRRHVRCSRALGLDDREVLGELLGGRLRRTLASVLTLVASLAILLDLYVGFVFERTLTTGGGYAAALGQLLARQDLGPPRLVGLCAVVACLAGLQLLRSAIEEADP
jgi:hypothetical protein